MSVFMLIRPLAILALASLLACKNDKDGSNTDSVGSTEDLDSDGYTADVDCDDDDNAVHPDAYEECNGVDDDCDGTIDNGQENQPFYADGDADGYGDPNVSVEACSAPEGYADNSDDCNDSDAAYNPLAEEDDCADPNDYNCDGSTGYEDADGDRFAACLECDDGDASVYPGATETCDGVDNDCDAVIDDNASDATTWYIDYDDDTYGSDRYTQDACEQPTGYVANADDCNDRSETSYPGGDEVCDGFDNDCDGTVDESDDAADATLWYIDNDGDGFGVEDASTLSCDQPAGYADNYDDCDDVDATINPDALEICDGIDNDCSGQVDGADADGATIYYVDADGDEYGLEDYPQLACESLEGYAETPGDCDDSDEDINPLATEYCNSVDDNCDGAVDEDSAVDASTWYSDLDGDGYGGTVGVTQACDQPDGYGPDADDCDDTDADISPDATEICNDGVDNNCDTTAANCIEDLSYSDSILLGEAANASTGSSMAVGDVDGDGDDDILIGASSEDTVGADAGAAYLVSSSVTAGTSSLSSATAKLLGEAADFRAGQSVSIGDLDGDGVGDLVVGAHRVTSSKTQRGAAYVVFGPVTGTASLSTRDVRFLGEAAFDRAGMGVATGGDLDGDGSEDLVIGAYTADSGSIVNAGTIYVVYGDLAASSTDKNLSTATAALQGEVTNDSIGADLAMTGDVNGDGSDDFLIGCASDDTNGSSAGAAYLVIDISTGVQGVEDASVKLLGEAENDNAGTSISAAGDVDGDGYEDLLVGSPGDDTSGDNAGAVYLIAGDVSGSSANLSDYMAKFLGDSTGDQVGGAVSGGGDVDGDGNPDVLLGATADELGASGAGAAYLVYGPISGEVSLSDSDAKFYGSEIGMNAGAPLSIRADTEGDGTNDVLISASNHDGGGTDAGAIFVLSGAGL